jgi:hypothetical protein
VPATEPEIDISGETEAILVVGKWPCENGQFVSMAARHDILEARRGYEHSFHSFLDGCRDPHHVADGTF